MDNALSVQIVLKFKNTISEQKPLYLKILQSSFDSECFCLMSLCIYVYIYLNVSRCVLEYVCGAYIT